MKRGKIRKERHGLEKKIKKTLRIATEKIEQHLSKLERGRQIIKKYVPKVLEPGVLAKLIEADKKIGAGE